MDSTAKTLPSPSGGDVRPLEDGPLSRMLLETHIDNLDTDSDDDQQEEKPPEDASKVANTEITEGRMIPAALTLPCPSTLRGFGAITAEFFGFESGAELKRVIETTDISRHIKEFDEVRRKFDAMHKTAEGFNYRPTLVSLEQHIGVLRDTNPARFELKASDLLASPFPNELDNYSVMLMQFKNAWFTAHSAPLSNRGVPYNMHLDRVYTLVKLVDKLTHGYQPLNKTRERNRLQHAPKTSRAIEAKQQADKTARKSIGTPDERQTATEQNRTVLVEMGRLVRQSEETARLQAVNEAALKKAAKDVAAKASPQVAQSGDDDEDLIVEEGLELNDPHIQHTSLAPGLEEREAMLAAKNAKKAEAVKLSKANKKRQKEGKPLNLQAVKNDAMMGFDTSDPRKAKRLINTYTTASWTADDSNPIERSFCDGWVVGIPTDTVEQLVEFKETDWLCDDEEDDMTFDTGTSEVIKADRPMTEGVHERLARLLQKPSAENVSKPDQSAPAAAFISGTAVDEDLLNIGDESSLSPEEREARLKARKNHRRGLAIRQKRHQTLRKVVDFTNTDGESVQKDSDKDFISKLCAERRYMALHDTDVPTEFQDNLDVLDGTNRRGADDPPSTDINAPSLRMTVDDACILMDNNAYQPKGYQKFLNITKTPRRKEPRVIGQSPTSFPNMWWQTNGAGDLFNRRIANIKKRVSQIEAALKAGDSLPTAVEKSTAGVQMGAIVGDEVGIGKTNTVALYRKVFVNNRKLELQQLRDNGDIEGLRNYPKPRPLIVVTQSHLVNQMSKNFAEFSSEFDVFAYGGGNKILAPDVRRINEQLTRAHPIFDQKNECNSQVVVVTSYETLQARHGPAAIKKYIRALEYKASVAVRHMFGQLRDPDRYDWIPPMDLCELFEEAVLDEAQNTKGVKNHSSYAIRNLKLDWVTIVTATPIPFKHQDFSGILSFLQSPYDNVDARRRLDPAKRDYPMLENPYEINGNGELVRPDDENYQYTSAAYDYFCCKNTMDFTSVGPVIAKLWAKFMIRRDFSSFEVIDPAGTVHRIGQSMPKSHRCNLNLKNKPHFQTLHDYMIKDHLSSHVMPDPSKPGTMVLNGKSTRILNLAAISPLFLLAVDVHTAKVEATHDTVAHGSSTALGGDSAEESSDDDQDDEEKEQGKSDFEDGDEEQEYGALKSRKRRRRMVESSHAKQYREHYLVGEDRGFLLKLSTDIYDNAKTRLNPPQHTNLFGHQHPNEMNDKLLCATIIRSSARLQAMYTVIGDQVDIRDEKALIFANGPWEEMLYAVLARTLGYKAEAILATMSHEDKQSIVHRFQEPLKRWSEPGFTSVDRDDIEVLVLSYHMNSGLNLHHYCHNLHAPSPPPSYAIWIQSCGRIIRFGQNYECVIIQYQVEGTYNTTQMATVMKNALSSIAALMCKHDAYGADTDSPITRVSTESLSHLHGYRGSLIDDRNPLFHAADDAGEIDRDLDDKTKFLRVLNTVLGLTFTVDGNHGDGSYEFTASDDIFSSFDLIDSHARTPKKRARLTDAIVPTPSKLKKSTKPWDDAEDTDMVGAEDDVDLSVKSYIAVSQAAIDKSKKEDAAKALSKKRKRTDEVKTEPDEDAVESPQTEPVIVASSPLSQEEESPSRRPRQKRQYKSAATVVESSDGEDERSGVTGETEQQDPAETVGDAGKSKKKKVVNPAKKTKVPESSPSTNKGRNTGNSRRGRSGAGSASKK